MRRLPWLDLLLLVLVPLWLIVLSLHVRQAWRGQLLFAGIYVAATTDAERYPVVTAYWPGQEVREAGPMEGDQLVSLNGSDLSCVGPFEFFARAQTELARVRAHDPGGTVPIVFLRGGERRNGTLPFVGTLYPWRMLPTTCAFALTGVLVLLNRPGTRIGRAFFLGAILCSYHWTWFFGGAREITYAWYGVYFLSGLMFPAILIAATLFPEGVLHSRHIPRWPWVFSVLCPVLLTAAVGAPLPPRFGLQGIYVLNVLFISAILAVLTRNYRLANARGRRQLRWGVFGMYAGLVPVFLAAIAILAEPSWWWLSDVAATAEVLIPLSILVAIVRFNLYDIDRLITSAIAYSILSVAFLVGVLLVVPRVADAASQLVDLDKQAGTTVMSVALAITLVAGQRFLHPAIERIFFRERYSLDQGIRALLAELGGVTKIRDLFDLVGRRLEDLFRPVSCVVYALVEDRYVPAFTRLRQADAPPPTTVSTNHPVVTEVIKRQAPLDLEEWMTHGRARDLSGEERAALTSVDAAVVFPVGDGEGSTALVILGNKRSGDVYSPGDLALLSAVRDAVSGTMLRLAHQKRTAAGPTLLPRKYEMLGEIGRGGMGSVYRVRHATLGTVYAMKILPRELASDAALVSRFRREARVMSQLRHPHIAQVIDFDREGSLYYFIMEYVEGVSLRQTIRERGRLALEEVLRIACQVAQGLVFAHQHTPSVVHRDINPANILIEGESQRAVIIDFGIAKILEPQESLRTNTGDVLGTLRYCAPEQLRGDSDVDARVDIYSLGMVIYEMLAGRELLAGMDRAQILAAVLHDDAPYVLPTDVPASLRGILSRALAKPRVERYPDASALLLDLQNAARSEGIVLSRYAEVARLAVAEANSASGVVAARGASEEAERPETPGVSTELVVAVNELDAGVVGGPPSPKRRPNG